MIFKLYVELLIYYEQVHLFYIPCRLSIARVKVYYYIITVCLLLVDRNAIIAYEETAEREMQWLL